MKETKNCPCPTGLEDSWENFPWARYPGGVTVSFALNRGNQMLLVKPSRWNVQLPQCQLKPGQVLADAVVWLHGYLAEIGARLVSGDQQPTVKSCVTEEGTFHVLILVPYYQASPLSVFESVDSAILLSGFAGDSPVIGCAAHVLRWGDADRHFPLGRIQQEEAMFFN